MKIPISKQINEYESSPKEIGSAIKGLNNKQLNFHITTSEWSINQVIVHLADTEIFYYERMRKIIVEEKPVFQSFDQDEWANHLFYNKQDFHLALNLLIAQRKSTAELLRLLPSNAWKRKGLHDGKEKTLYDIFTTALYHIPAGLEQINNIKRKIREVEPF